MCGYGEIGDKPNSSVQLVWNRWWSTERIGERDIPPYVVGVGDVLVRRKMVISRIPPYNLFGIGGGVRRESGKEIFLRTW